MNFLKHIIAAMACITIMHQPAQTMEFTEETSLAKKGGELEIRDKIIGEETLRALADPMCQKYHRLSIHTCGIGSGEHKYSTSKVNENAAALIPDLVAALSNQTEVISLCLAGNVLNDADIEILAPALQKLTQLKFLIFYMNRISDAGASILATDVLPYLKALISLDLAGNDLTDNGMAPLIGRLESIKF